MPTTQESLQSILARKPDYAAPVVRADSPVSEPTPKPSPEPIYTEHLAPQSECQTWLDQGRLYALIDGLDLPDLPGRVSQRHPDVDVALYDGLFGAHHETETPRFVRVDAELMDWLQPVMEGDPGWGWCMVLRDDLAGLSSDAAVKTLVDHFRQLIWVKEPQGEQWVFRLHDPRVLSNWLQCATAEQIQHFMLPLRHVLIHQADAIRVLTLRAEHMSQAFDAASPQPWPESTFQAMHRLGREDLLLRLQRHLHAQHPKTRDWADQDIRQFIMDNGNRAYRHGLKDEQALSKFLSLCAVLGADFDTREDGAWARDILNNPMLQGQRRPIDQLVDGALERLDNNNGDPP